LAPQVFACGGGVTAGVPAVAAADSSGAVTAAFRRPGRWVGDL
jgi:hypothetical protein